MAMFMMIMMLGFARNLSIWLLLDPVSDLAWCHMWFRLLGVLRCRQMLVPTNHPPIDSPFLTYVPSTTRPCPTSVDHNSHGQHIRVPGGTDHTAVSSTSSQAMRHDFTSCFAASVK
jgi:hypothetical protein